MAAQFVSNCLRPAFRCHRNPHSPHYTTFVTTFAINHKPFFGASLKSFVKPQGLLRSTLPSSSVAADKLIFDLEPVLNCPIFGRHSTNFVSKCTQTCDVTYLASCGILKCLIKDLVTLLKEISSSPNILQDNVFRRLQQRG